MCREVGTLENLFHNDVMEHGIKVFGVCLPRGDGSILRMEFQLLQTIFAICEPGISTGHSYCHGVISARAKDSPISAISGAFFAMVAKFPWQELSRP
jgi:hypothetical protein